MAALQREKGRWGVSPTSDEKVQSSLRYQTTRRKRPRHIVLFIVIAPYTWLYVKEMFFIFFFLANCRELTSSLAFDANGVTFVWRGAQER